MGLETWGLDQSTSQGGKNWHDENQHKLPGNQWLFLDHLSRDYDSPPGLRSHMGNAQCGGFPPTANCKSPIYLSSNTSDSVPTPGSSETQMGILLYMGLKAIRSNSICGSFNSIKMVTKGKCSALLLGWDQTMVIPISFEQYLASWI